ncbi:MAG TPA: hypothetical protein VE824_08005 [Gaiellales bacterium]|nr:hypothetical protein [Gaiellales bacterium]
MTPDSDPASEPLLLPTLIRAHRDNAAGDGSITRIVRGLMRSPVTDAERAGERLRVFGWELPADPGRLRWCYRVVGEETGRTHVTFTLSVPGATSDLPCRVLGLQLQITLNGVEATAPEELDAYVELAEAARGAR